MLVRRNALLPIDFDGLAIYDYTAVAGTSSSLALIEVPPGVAHKEAWSRRSDKYYLLVQGELRFSLGDEDFVLHSGDFCIVPQGKRFSYENASAASATLVLVHTPSFDLDSEVFTDAE